MLAPGRPGSFAACWPRSDVIPSARRSSLPALVLLYVLALIPFTPSIGDLRKAKSATPSVVLSDDGVVLAEFKRINREWVPLEKIAPNVDRRADRDRRPPLLRPSRHRLQAHGRRRCSTRSRATCRAARRSRSSSRAISIPRRSAAQTSITRKIKEAITALKIEAVYTKREILETYLNTVPFLFNAFGIEMAARTYFDKSADKLDVLEAATLVGMLKATQRIQSRAATRSARSSGATSCSRRWRSRASSRQAQLAVIDQAAAASSTSSARPSRPAPRRTSCSSFANG